MTAKERVLSLLLARRGQFTSGETLADSLGVSRTAVWKEINALRADGYTITAVPNKGYQLVDTCDLLSAAEISSGLSEKTRRVMQIQVEREVDSTNAVLRRQAMQGGKEGLVLIASAQTQGRGRLGRQFYSPADTGIYLSLLLRPVCAAEQAVSITTAAAVAVCEAIESLTDEQAQIKWVNDIFVSGKKVCGILTEAAMNLESMRLDYAVLGIGINAYAPEEGFPDALREIAGALKSTREESFRSRLCAEILSRFWDCYTAPDANLAERYRRRCFVCGKKITVHRGGTSVPATAIDITDNYSLRVRYEDGREEALSSGEISVRLCEED